MQWADGSSPSSSNSVVPYPFTLRIAGHSLFCLLFAIMERGAGWLFRDGRGNSNNAAARAAPAHE